MTAEQFTQWLAAMKERYPKIAPTGAACARLLGVSANSVVTMKRRGADMRTALACRALYHGLEPWE